MDEGGRTAPLHRIIRVEASHAVLSDTPAWARLGVARVVAHVCNDGGRGCGSSFVIIVRRSSLPSQFGRQPNEADSADSAARAFGGGQRRVCLVHGR